MSGPVRRYLDNAATSWPKPPEVLSAWEHAARVVGATAGRAAYREAVEADAIRTAARGAVARMLGGVDPARIALPAGCTLALNQAIHGLVMPGDHVIASAADHNASLRPLAWLERRGVIKLTIVPCDGLGLVDPVTIAAAWRPGTRLVVCTHASNVTGAVQDVPAIAAVAHEREGLLLLDAAQTLGQFTLDAVTLGADLIAAPAHKWLLGTGGLGMLWARPGVEPVALLQGGTGSGSDSLEMPEAFAARHEAGTPDVPALAGLAAAVAWLEAGSVPAIAARCRGLAAVSATQLRDLRGVKVFAAEGGPPIVSFVVEGYDPAEVAVILEQASGLQVRAGFHCAALVHGSLGTTGGGTVRVSFGPFNTDDDVAVLVEAVAMLAGG